MPAESTPSARDPQPSHPTSIGNIKCSICGLGNPAGTSSSSSASPSSSANDGFIVLSDPIQRICGRCINIPEAMGIAQDADAGADTRDGLGISDRENGVRNDAGSLGLGLRGVAMEARSSSSIESESDEGRDSTHVQVESPEMGMGTSAEADTDSSSTDRSRSNTPSSPTTDSTHLFSQSLPAHPTLPWMTTAGKPLGLDPSSGSETSSTRSSSTSDHVHAEVHTNARNTAEREGGMRRVEAEVESLPNPLLDIAKARVPSVGRGALYPGSVFKGSQTSGRSAYDVEIQLLDVNFLESSVSGYLSISHLTDSHPHLTTYFTGEIIGPKHGFITGSRYGASEHDDMRHWGRFEQFRRPATRQDLIRPELFFRDPLPDRSRGETRAKERDFVFLRIKEKFLVPDHKVRDISGASFAGFYYAMVDLSATVALHADAPSTPTSPPTPKSPLSSSAPTLTRHGSSAADVHVSHRAGSRPEAGRRRESANRLKESREVRGEATIRGYYFHSLNQEPFQELFLTHVPQRSHSTFEFR